MSRPWWRLAAAAGLLSAVGMGTLAYVVLYHYPTLPARMVFFWALVVTGAGWSLLPLAVLHRRFTRRLPPAGVLLREAVLVGGFVALWAWLQMDRMASPWVLMALGAALVLVELVSLSWPGARR